MFYSTACRSPMYKSQFIKRVCLPKSVSLIKKHRLIKDQLNHFPTLYKTQASSFLDLHHCTNLSFSQEVKSRRGSEKCRNAEVGRQKLQQVPHKFFKKSIENMKIKKEGLAKKNKNQVTKESSGSSTSLVSSYMIGSLASTRAMNWQGEVVRLSEQNKKYRNLIEKQRAQISTLEAIISEI